jgi:hypothetical protein
MSRDAGGWLARCGSGPSGHLGGNRMKGIVRLALAALLAALVLPPGAVFANDSPNEDSTASGCNLGDGVKHVVNVVFDNTHFTRDNPNVPSDLEQMPALLNFIKGHGTLLTNQHTPLISHTATDILTSLTGVYGDRMGVPVSNTFRYYNPNGTTNPGVSFAYWTSPIYDFTNPPHQSDLTYNMLTAEGKNAPAPWVPFTRAGCNVGGVATANLELENIGIDIPTVFGPGSPQAAEVASNPGQAAADFIGIAIHCAKDAALCSNANSGRPDLLPDEPGGYTGYQGLFGHKYVAPQIHPGSPLTDLGGNVIEDTSGHIGFPGFDGMPASVSLSYAASMLTHGVPVTYVYISAGHQKHPGTKPWGPGEAGYVAQLKTYDDAFATFFSTLAQNGITQKNTVFAFTADEGDHLIAGPPSPANCDGVTVPCTYAKIGEVAGNLKGLIATQSSATTSFTVHSDIAPTVYITGNPPQTSSTTRDLERAAGTITATNPYTSVNETIDNYLADQAQMRLLHMLTADRQRDPTFTMFAKPDYFLFAGAPNCNSPCIKIDPSFNWNHGGISPDINVTWLGVVGPGVEHLGVTGRLWTDHADIRPTLLALTGLKDDYAHQGRPITEVLSETREDLNRLADVYKQIDAPVGQLSLDSLRFATRATLSTTAGDQTYLNADIQIAAWNSTRDALAAEMIALLDTTAPDSERHDDSDVHDLIRQGQRLLAEVHAAAA